MLKIRKKNVENVFSSLLSFAQDIQNIFCYTSWIHKNFSDYPVQ